MGERIFLKSEVIEIVGKIKLLFDMEEAVNKEGESYARVYIELCVHRAFFAANCVSEGMKEFNVHLGDNKLLSLETANNENRYAFLVVLIIKTDLNTSLN